MAGARFGRNMPIARPSASSRPSLYEPNPRLVSHELLARRSLRAGAAPQRSRAGLAAVHGPRLAEPRRRANQDARRTRSRCRPAMTGPAADMTILRTCRTDRSCPADEGRPATYRNTETHWWDGSQIYGSDLERQQRGAHRSGDRPVAGRTASSASIRRGPPAGRYRPATSRPEPRARRRERQLVDRPLGDAHAVRPRAQRHRRSPARSTIPRADGEWLFQKARLVNAALIAKIHTIEWTPALMNSPEGRLAMRGNWWGLLGEQYRARLRPASATARSSPASRARPTDHHAAPYAMTEEFTAVYRMHSLMPDEFSFRRHADDDEILPARSRRRWRADRRAALYGRVGVRRRSLLARHQPSRRAGAAQLSRTGCAGSTDKTRTASSSTWPRSTSCATASAACRATAPSAATSACTCPRPSPNSPTIPTGSASLREVYGRGREGRSPGRHAGREQRPHGRRLRLLRHGLPHLHPDGLAAAEERPLLHRRLPARGLHAGRLRLGRRTTRCAASWSGTARTCAALRRRPQRLLPLGQGDGAERWRDRCASPASST